MGRRPIGDRAMTPGERKRRWLDRHRVRLWPGEDQSADQLRAWSEGALRPVPRSNVIRLQDRRK